MFRCLLGAMLLLSLLTVFAADKPVVRPGHAEIISVPLSPERANLVRNLADAKSSGEIERARSFASLLEIPAAEIIPTGVSGSTITEPALSGRERPSDFGSDIYVASATYIEKAPRIARAVTGELFCVYEIIGGPSDTNTYIAIRKSINDGASWTPLLEIHNPSRDLVHPRIAIGEGTQNWVFVAYESRTPSGGSPSVEIAKFAFDGTGGSTLTIDGASFTDKYSPAVCTDDYSYYYIYVSYIRNNLLGTNLYVARSTDYGATWTSQSVDGSGDIESDISYGNGNVYVVTQTSAENGDIRLAKSSDFGATYTTPIVVSTTHKDYFPQVAASSESMVMVAYGYKYSASDHDVYYSISYNYGNSFSTGRALALSTLKETLPSIAAGQIAFFATYYKSGQILLAEWVPAWDDFDMGTVISDGATNEEIAPDIEALRTTADAPCPGAVWTKRYTPTDFDVMFDKDCCPKPVASFTADTTTGTAPLIVNFTNTSTGAETYDWDFGDGSAHSALLSPSHTYMIGGDFTVSLTATNTCGNDIQTTAIHVVCPEVVASFTMSPTSTGEVPLNINFASTSSGADNFSWDFGDGSAFGVGATVSHEYDSIGDFTVRLIASNACENQDTATGLVHTYAPSVPVAEFTPASLDFDTVSVGDYRIDSVIISNTGTGNLWIHATVSDPAFSISESDSFNIAPSGNYVVRVIFSPTDDRAYSSSLDMSTNDPAHPVLSVALSGVGKDAGSSDSISVSPALWDFGSIRIHECASRRIYVHNNTSDTVWIDSVRIVGDAAFSFPTFVTEPIPPGSSRYHEVNFCPTIIGAVSSVFRIYTEVSSHSIPLSGTGFSSTACTDYGDWQLCADILTDIRAQGHVTFLDGDADTVLTLEEVAGIAFIDLSSMGGTGLCKFHRDDGSTITMMAGGFSLSSSGQITSHPSIADINVLPDSLLHLPYDLDVSVPPITINIPEHWWRIRGMLKLKDSTSTIAEIGVSRTEFGNGDVDYFLSDFGVSLFGGYFELFLEDVSVSDDFDTIKAGELRAKISKSIVPRVSAWLEHDSTAYDSLHTGSGDWFKLDAKSIAILDGKLMSIDVKFSIPDMSFAAGISPLTIRGVKAELKMTDGRIRRVAGEGKFGYKGLMPDWAGSGAYIRVSLAFNELGWERVGLGFHGISPGVPLGATGFFLTGVDGEVGNMTAGIESIYVEFSCDLKGGPTLPLVGGIIEMTPTVYLDFADDLYRLDGDVSFVRRLVTGYGLLEYRSNDVGGGWGVRGAATISAGISSAVTLDGGIDAHAWSTHTGGFHFTGHGGVTASLKHNAIFWLCPSSTISVGAHAYFGEFRLPSDMGGHWGAKGVLDWQPFGIRPQVGYIDGGIHINSDAERYSPRESRRFLRPDRIATVNAEYDLTETDINIFIARTAMSHSAEFTVITASGTTITSDSCSTTDSLANRYYFESNAADGNRYMGYIIRGSNPGRWTATLDDLEPGDDTYAMQVSGFHKPKSATLANNGTRLSLHDFASADSIRVTRYIDKVRSGEFKNIGKEIDKFLYSPVDTLHVLPTVNASALGLSEGDYYIYCILEDNEGSIVFASDNAGIIHAPTDLTPPFAPTGCVAVVSDTIIKAAWNNNSEPDLLGYRFYKGVDSIYTIVWWDTVDVADMPRATIEDWKWNIQDTVGIIFGVSAYDASGNESAITTFHLTGGFGGDYDPTAPVIDFDAPVVNLIARTISLGWHCTALDVKFYRLSGGLYAGDEMFVLNLPPDSAHYLLSDLDLGMTYHLRIVAVDNNLNVSAPDEATVNFFDAADSDHDGLPDWWEIFYFGSISLYSGADDPDGDLLINLHEFMIGTAPNNKDTDNDRVSDYYEYSDTALDPLSDADLDGDRIADDWETFYFGGHLPDPMNTDADSDGLIDFNEYVYAANPLVFDTDGGGASDGDEVTNRTDPLDATDDNVQLYAIELSTGWNMVSVPGIAIRNQPTDVFAGLDVYHYNAVSGEYETPVTIEPGCGYFVLSFHDTTLDIEIHPIENYSITIFRGWNQIGSVIGTAPFSDPLDDPDGAVLWGTYGYDTASRSYFATTELEEGRAYWIASNSIANLYVGLASGGRARKADVANAASLFGPPPPPPSFYVSERKLPENVELYGAYPNPFNSATTIQFALPGEMEVGISITDILGREICDLSNGALEAGFHSITWDARTAKGRDVPSGIYFYKLKTAETELSGRMILLK